MDDLFAVWDFCLYILLSLCLFLACQSVQGFLVIVFLLNSEVWKLVNVVSALLITTRKAYQLEVTSSLKDFKVHVILEVVKQEQQMQQNLMILQKLWRRCQQSFYWEYICERIWVSVKTCSSGRYICLVSCWQCDIIEKVKLPLTSLYLAVDSMQAFWETHACMSRLHTSSCWASSMDSGLSC